MDHECLLEEREWINERLAKKLNKPYFFKNDNLVVSSEERELALKKLKDRAWIDRNGCGRTWYHKIIVYHTLEEYVWMRLL